MNWYKSTAKITAQQKNAAIIQPRNNLEIEKDNLAKSIEKKFILRKSKTTNSGAVQEISSQVYIINARDT